MPGTERRKKLTVNFSIVFLRKIPGILLLLFYCSTFAQDISFFHLSKKDGLSDNRISGVVMDKNGLLWIGTSEGLNCYDGYTVKKFYKEEYPALQNNNIVRLTCDEMNRLWILFADKSITMLDEDRIFHIISIVDQGQPVTVDFLLPYTSRGVLFLSGSHLYAPDKKNPLKIERLEWHEDARLNNDFERINIWDKDKLVFSGNNQLILFDVTKLVVSDDITVPGILAAARLTNDEALITKSDNEKLSRVNLKTKKVVQRYGRLKDQYGDEMMNYPRSIYYLQEQKFILTSAYAGLYLFDANDETLIRYKHDPVDPKSISANNTTYLFSDTSGYFFITSGSAGLNYFNINHYLAKWQPSFMDSHTGKIFDGYINCISQDRNGIIWLGTQNSLIEWDRKNDNIKFHSYGKINGSELAGTEEVRAICLDKSGRIWIGLNRFGVVVLNRKKEVIKYFYADGKNNALSSNFIYDIKEAPDGKMWIAGSKGLDIVDPGNFQIRSPGSYSYLRALEKKVCQFIWFHNNEAWIATNRGAYRVNLTRNSWCLFNNKTGLRDENVSCITGGDNGNIYLGTTAGLYIMRNDKIVGFYNRTNGLSSNKCEGLLKDNDGSIWIGNNNSLICYNPVNKSMIAYGDASGLSDAGLKPNAFLKLSDGEILWGTGKGLNYFKPRLLQKLQLPLNVLVHSLSTADSSFWLAKSKDIALPWSKKSISFAFSAIDLYRVENIKYKYMLEGADESWKILPRPREVQYSNLSPGSYLFRLMASRDGHTWVESNNTIGVTILAPWWRSNLFIVVSFIILFSTVAFVIRMRSKKIRSQGEQIETEKAINYFASSMHEQTTTDDILWDVARNCIGRLNFEDCVIYLIDEHRPVLIQKAAWGPKTNIKKISSAYGDSFGKHEETDKIINPIEIPVGKGIVGTVAATGKAEIVNDTSKDKRYIVDDARRSSEISVPIIYNGKILGIIDSENSRKSFFTQKHLSILTTIASLCANKIVRLKAETEKQNAIMELLDHKRKTAEAQLKSLRLQMNPHFLFNSLNSIQQIILAGDEKVATLYLSKFSRLLRLVLTHSDKDKVTLKEELEMLTLYIELESLRFKESFKYEISCDENIDADEIKIPTLLIQPFVENAIWHGLLHKEGSRSLYIKLTEDSAENILCIVRDNGIGREASKKINVQNNYASKGIAVAEERLKAYNNQHLLKSKVLIEDLADINGKAAGTKVTMTLPLLN